MKRKEETEKEELSPLSKVIILKERYLASLVSESNQSFTRLIESPRE
jgi:hypothetical protein